jgi:hypothetical protein
MDLRSKTTALFTDLVLLNMTETKGSYAHFVHICRLHLKIMRSLLLTASRVEHRCRLAVIQSESSFYNSFSARLIAPNHTRPGIVQGRGINLERVAQYQITTLPFRVNVLCITKSYGVSGFQHMPSEDSTSPHMSTN